MDRQLPRMFTCALLTVVLFLAASHFRGADPSSLLAVSLYKAHLMSLGGWGGYWLDRWLFPYDRPHAYLECDDSPEEVAEGFASAELVASNAFSNAMLRRAIIVAACVICAGLGA